MKFQTKETARHFLSRDGVDSCGRSLESILAWLDNEIEFRHDFYQYEQFPFKLPHELAMAARLFVSPL